MGIKLHPSSAWNEVLNLASLGKTDRQIMPTGRDSPIYLGILVGSGKSREIR